MRSCSIVLTKNYYFFSFVVTSNKNEIKEIFNKNPIPLFQERLCQHYCVVVTIVTESVREGVCVRTAVQRDIVVEEASMIVKLSTRRRVQGLPTDVWSHPLMEVSCWGAF